MEASAGKLAPDALGWPAARVGVGDTMAGMDVLLHNRDRLESVAGSRAAGMPPERDEERIGCLEGGGSWPVVKRTRRTWAAGSSSKTRFCQA